MKDNKIDIHLQQKNQLLAQQKDWEYKCLKFSSPQI